MADERKRIIQYPEATSLDDEDYLLGDSVIRGSRKVKVKDVIGVNQVNVDGTSVVDGNTANINLSGKQNVLTPGDNITIDNDVISATDTTYTAGTNVTIVGTTISAKDTTYTAGANIIIDSNNVISADTGGGASYVAGDNITIEGNVISATDTTYTAGENITITEDNVINSIPPYVAGENVTINANNVISATDTTYTAGDNISISSDNVISGVATTYTAGTNITIDANDVISATDTVYTAGDNITISDQNVISSTAGIYTAGENITIDQDNVISATDTTYSEFTEDEPGLVPAPGEPSGRVLMDDGSWDVPDNAIEINSGESPTDILETITTGEETYDAAVVRQTVNRDEDEDFALLGGASADDETETEGTNKFPDLTFNPVESSLSIDHIADTDTETDSDSSISITSTDVILNGTSSETRSRLQLTPSMWAVKHDATKTNIDFNNNQVAFYCDTTSIEDDTHQEIVYTNPIVVYTGSGDHRTTESYAIRYRIDAARSIVGEGDDFDICIGIKSTYVTDPYCEPTDADWVAVNTYSKYDIEGQLIEGRIDLDDSISDPNVYLYVIGNGWEMVLESIEVVISQTDNTWDGAHASLKAAISEGMAGTVEQIESLGHEASLEVLLSYDEQHSTETDPARKTPKLIFNTKQGNLLVSDGDPTGPSGDPLTAENIMMVTPEDIVMWEGGTWDGTHSSLIDAIASGGTDTKVTQTPITNETGTYRILLSMSADDTVHTEETRKSSKALYDAANEAFTFGSRLSGSTNGTGSLVEGSDNVASGSYSHAEGHWTSATSNGCHSEGNQTVAGQPGSTSYRYAHSEGIYTSALGGGSHAEGNSTCACGYLSHAEGNETISSGAGAHAEGGYSSVAVSDKGTFAKGNNAHAEGYLTNAFGNNAHAEGHGTSANTDSHAEGRWTVADGLATHAEGDSTTASGDAAHAEGISTVASGIYSHAEGNSTTASHYAHSEGLSTSAGGHNSHTEGYSTISTHKSQHVFGEYNTMDDSAATASFRGNYVEIVGNGTGGSARSNARTLSWDGTEWLLGNLDLGGATSDIVLSGTGNTWDGTNTSLKAAIAAAGGGAVYREVTQQEYDDLPASKNTDGIIYFITDNS